jgi:DNA-binding transcriptional ArsR family regulator
MEVGTPFGSSTRTRVLFALRLLEQSYARELARVLRVPLSVVQKALRTLDRDGMIVGRLVGRTRVFQINPRYFARKELDQFLGRLLEPEMELKRQVALLRRRPRRTGKPL